MTLTYGSAVIWKTAGNSILSTCLFAFICILAICQIIECVSGPSQTHPTTGSTLSGRWWSGIKSNRENTWSSHYSWNKKQPEGQLLAVFFCICCFCLIFCTEGADWQLVCPLLPLRNAQRYIRCSKPQVCIEWISLQPSFVLSLSLSHSMGDDSTINIHPTNPPPWVRQYSGRIYL